MYLQKFDPALPEKIPESIDKFTDGKDNEKLKRTLYWKGECMISNVTR